MSLSFISLNWVIYFVFKLSDIQNMYFYFLFVSVINIGLGVYNIFVLNGGSFPPPDKLLLFIFEAPVFLFIFPGLLFIFGFFMREKEVVFTEKNIKNSFLGLGKCQDFFLIIFNFFLSPLIFIYFPRTSLYCRVHYA